MLRVGLTLGSFRAPEFPQEKIHIVEEEEEEGSGRVQRKEFFKVKLKSLNYLTIFLSCSNSNSQNPTEMN